MNTTAFTKKTRSPKIPGTSTHAERFAAAKAKLEAAQAELDAVKANLIPDARNAWLGFNRNNPDPLSTVDFGECTVTFAGQYKNAEVLPEDLRRLERTFTIDDAGVEEPEAWASALRKLLVDFGAKAEITIDASGQTQEFADRLLKLRDRYGLRVEVKETWKPVEGFETVRHTHKPADNTAWELAGLGTKITIK
jgi:hypothetical protein